ncbi:MAG: MMPL family transporter [Planctomycetes bacterium]|nr:MMPL family transporter [Planctomycetota bacterium]
MGRYDEARAAGRAPSAALEEALGATGPAITVGALTTGGAFCGAVFTDFKGLREFGVVAGFGVVASLLVTLSVVPALILLNDRRRAAAPRPVSAGHLRWLDRWTSQRPRLVLALVLVLSLAAVFGAARLRYQGNLLLLQDQTLDSVQLELKLLRDQHTTSWFLAYSARDLSELAEVTSRAALLPSVQRVESVLDLYPPGAERRLVPAQRLAGRLEAWVALEARPSQAPALAAANLRLCEALEEALEQALAGGLDDALVVLERLLEEAREVKAALPEGPLPGATLRYEARLTAALRERLRPFGQGSLGPARADRLPAVLRERFVGAHGRYLLRIYPKGNLWDPDELAAFLAEVEAEIPGVTGVPAMLHGASTVMVEAYRKAGWIALAVVTLSLLLLFRSLRPTLVALGSLAVGVLWTAGLMGWLGFDLNPANLIALPLMLGIGIDSAVHVVHRAREGRPGPLIATSLGRALIYSGLTSVASFGTLALGSHPGTASMGTAISVGILCCVSAGLVVAPTLWTLSGPKAADRNEPTEAAAA